jgi:hypothetical protein
LNYGCGQFYVDIFFTELDRLCDPGILTIMDANKGGNILLYYFMTIMIFAGGAGLGGLVAAIVAPDPSLHLGPADMIKRCEDGAIISLSGISLLFGGGIGLFLFIFYPQMETQWALSHIGTASLVLFSLCIQFLCSLLYPIMGAFITKICYFMWAATIENYPAWPRSKTLLIAAFWPIVFPISFIVCPGLFVVRALFF